jgi:glycosyltransferase involved in cell wall biosynthesis
MGYSKKKKIVISGINIRSGGSLSIFNDCLDFLSKSLTNEYEVIALVHNKNYFYYPNIIYYEFPLSRISWLFRTFYEYFYFYFFSKKIKPYLWFSVHDITPNVKSDIQVVYCHNPAPFYNISILEAYFDPKFFLFNLFYKQLYRVNIKKNNFIIVQQQWMRERFIKLFNLNKNKIIVSTPDKSNFPIENAVNEKRNEKNEFIFFYPSFPRVFKNFELIFEAADILNKTGSESFKVYITIDGTENKYSRYILKKYAHVKNIIFTGLLTRDEVFDYYLKSDCLLFPSKLETWGLPITEMKSLNKPILAADLEYAHETVGKYDKVRFFNPYSAINVADEMKKMINNPTFNLQINKSPDNPFAVGWKDLFSILLGLDNVN